MFGSVGSKDAVEVNQPAALHLGDFQVVDSCQRPEVTPIDTTGRRQTSLKLSHGVAEQPRGVGIPQDCSSVVEAVGAQRRAKDFVVGELAASRHPDDIVSELLGKLPWHGYILSARVLRAIEVSGRVGANPTALVSS